MNYLASSIRHSAFSEENTNKNMPALRKMQAFIRSCLQDRQNSKKIRVFKFSLDKTIETVDSWLNKIEINTPEEKRPFIMLLVAILFSAVCHVVQVLFFTFLGSLSLVIINSLSICIYVVCTILLIKKKTAAAGLLFSSEISVVAVIIAYLIGIDTFLFAYFFVVLLIQMIIPYAGWKIRIPTIMGILVLMSIGFKIGATHLPLVDITPIKTAYSIFNLSIGTGSVISIIAVSNMVNKIIWQLNKTELDR